VTNDVRRHKFQKLLDTANTIIFDFDGVLADSEKFHYLSYSEVFARYGHTIDEAAYYIYWTSLGQGSRGEIERHKLNLDPVEIRDEKRPIFSNYCHDGSIKLFDESIAFLELLKSTDHLLTIASGSTGSDIKAILRNGGVLDRFTHIIGSDTVPAIKPAPDIFLKMLDVAKKDPWECVVIEDAEKGVEAAVEANIPVIVVRTPEAASIKFETADLVLESHAELIDFARAIVEG